MNVKRISIYLIILIFIVGVGYGLLKQKQDFPKEQENFISVGAEEKEKKHEENADRPEEQIKTEGKIKTEEKVKPVEQNSPKSFSPIWPLKGEIIKGYGLQYSELFADYRFHPGIDIAASLGKQVKVVQSGQVILVEKTPEQKVTIEIDHGEGWLTKYSYLDKSLVHQGEQVEQAQTLGIIGQTSQEEKKLFLHFAIKQNEQWINPLDYLK